MRTRHIAFGFGMVLSALLLAACGGSGTGSSATVSGTTSAATASTLGDTKGTLTVPAASFDTDLTVTYSSGGVDTSDISGATVISTPVTVTFSSATPVTGEFPITLTLTINAGDYADAIAADRSVYALIKVEGDELGSDMGTNTATWLPVIGSIDTSANTLTIRFMASAATIRAVVVTGNNLRLATSAIVSANISKTARPFKAEKKAEETLGQHQWAVLCENNLLSDGGDGSCNTTELPADLGKSPVIALRDALNSVSTALATQGFTTALLYQATVQEFIDANLTGTLTKAALNAIADKSTIFNIAYLTNAHKQCKDNDTIACYIHGNGIIAFGEDFDDPPALSDGADIVAHELTHAVQAMSCKSCSVRDADNNRPNVGFVEGTAEFVGQYFNAGQSASEVKTRGTNGVSRPWIIPLGTVSKDTIPYETFEFYALALDGDISLLPNTFAGFESANGQIFNQRLDAAFNQHSREAFIKAVALRNVRSINVSNYKGFNGNADWFPYYSDSVKSFAANHYVVSAPFSDSSCFSKIQIMTGTSENVVAIVVSNVIYDGAATIDLGDGTFANYVTGSNAMMAGRDRNAQCTLDVIVANTETGAAADDIMGYSILVGFD